MTDADLYVECPRHGKQLRLSTYIGDKGTTVVALACGCDVCAEPSIPIAPGDIVLYSSALYLVTDIVDELLTIANTDAAHIDVPVGDVKYIGPDKITGVALKRIPSTLQEDDYVEHQRDKLVGRIVELLGGSVRCIIYVANNGTSYECTWPVCDLRLLSPQETDDLCDCDSQPHLESCQLWREPKASKKRKKKKDEEGSWTLDPIHEPPHTVTPKHAITTADLIRDEVRYLESEQRNPVRPLRTSAPTVKQPEPKEEEKKILEPMPKRPSEW